MAKSQPTKSKSFKGAVDEKPLNGTKAGRVVKSNETPKAKSKDIAKSVATAALNGKKEKVSKKAKKSAPSDSEDSDSSADEEEKDDSSSESDSESESEKKTVPGSNGVSKKAAADLSSDDSSSAESDGDSDQEKVSAKAVKPAKVNGTAALSTSADESSDAESEDSSDSSEDSDEEAAKPKINGNAAKLNGAEKKDAGSESDDSENDSEDSSDSSDDEEEKASSKQQESAAKKRKADETTVTPAKKTRTEGDEAPKKNLFIGNLSWNIDEEWLRREFEGFGELVGCRIVTDRDTGRSKGFGYVEFADAASAEKAQQEKHQQELDGRALNVDFAVPRPEQSPFQKKERANQRANQFGDNQKSAPSDTLFVGNLSFDATTDMVSEIFSEFGTVTRCRLPTDQETGAVKGFAYVAFTSVDEAKAALEGMTGQAIAGRTVRLDFATPRTEGGSRGGRGGFGDRGSRGGFGDRGGRGGFGGRGGRGGGRGGARGGRGGGSYNRGGFGDFKGSRVAFD